MHSFQKEVFVGHLAQAEALGDALAGVRLERLLRHLHEFASRGLVRHLRNAVEQSRNVVSDLGAIELGIRRQLPTRPLLPRAKNGLAAIPNKVLSLAKIRS